MSNKKRILEKIEKEIRELEYAINNSKSINLKLKFLRRFSIVLRVLLHYFPYASIPVLVAIPFSAFGASPFILDNQKYFLMTETNMDNLDHIRYEQQYLEKQSINGSFSYTSQWEEKKDGFYSRTIKTYKIKEIDEETVINLLSSDTDEITLEDIFGEADSSKVECKNHVTEEEMMEKPYFEATMYSQDLDDFIYMKETSENNLGITFLWVCVFAFVEAIYHIVITEKSDYDFERVVRKAKEKYPYLNKEKLQKKLQIKRDNYERLTR